MSGRTEKITRCTKNTRAGRDVKNNVVLDHQIIWCTITTAVNPIRKADIVSHCGGLSSDLRAFNATVRSVAGADIFCIQWGFESSVVDKLVLTEQEGFCNITIHLL